MKKFAVGVALLFAVQFACAQFLFSPKTNTQVRGVSESDIMQNIGGSMNNSDEDAAIQPRMHASDESGISAKQFFGQGTGSMISFGTPESFSTSYGFGSGFYMPIAGADIIPVFAMIRHNFWFHNYDNAAYGSFYGYAAGGPAFGIGNNPWAPSFGSFLQSLTFRPGAGAVAAFGAELGGEEMGWSVFTEAGLTGYSFIAQLGPQKTYAAPYFSFGVRRGISF
jgi:hypothetical protein